MNTRAALEFASWLRQNHPGIYRRAATQADITLERRNQNKPNSGLGYVGEPETAEKSGWLSTFMTTVAGLGTTYLSLKGQRDQLKINLQRAELGLAPIDVAGAPVITTRVQLPPATIDKITASAGMQVNKLLLFGAIGVGLFFFLKKK